MTLLRLNKVSIAFGTRPLLDSSNLQIGAGERVGLIGRNGEGKSTLLKIVSGAIHPDSGEIWRQPTLRVAYLDQSPELFENLSVYDTVSEGLGEIGTWLSQYHSISVGSEPEQQKMKQLGELQQLLESHNGWQIQQRVESILSRLNLNGDQKISELSGGWRRRVALAQALVIEPQLLLLDEPTNHLDIETIIWLEQQLLQFNGALLFITHDRTLLQKLATRIVDLERGRLVSWSGGYSDYLRKKAAALEEEARHNSEFDKKLAQEEVWIRQGIKARRTRNEGRVRSLKKLRKQRANRYARQGQVNLELDSGNLSGKRVIEAEDLCFGYGETTIVRDFSTTIIRGDRVGLIGENGSGKTTLIQLLLGQQTPISGSVKLGTNLEIAYFDQHRTQLNRDQTVVEVAGDGNDFIVIKGRKRHVISYLADFLFAPHRARSPVGSLSGGEKNRLLLARLFAKPANLLVMDEPTNDLDVETLELLEDLLISFEGTLLLVSHDRSFLDNVITSTVVFEGQGVIREYVGGYTDWLNQRPAEKDRAINEKKQDVAPKPRRQKTKLNYNDRKELEEIPARIDNLETQQTELNDVMTSPGFYQQGKDKIKKTLEEVKQLERELEGEYDRWHELESLLETKENT